MRFQKIVTSLFVSSLFFVSIPAQAKDACETVLCMFGKLKGENPSECSPAVQDYFNIFKTKKGKIKWSATSDARKAFLDSCPTADDDATKKINDTFGKTWG